MGTLRGGDPPEPGRPDSGGRGPRREGTDAGVGGQDGVSSVPSSLSRVRPRTDNLAQRRVSSSHSVPSLHMLMSQFEDRYKEMGQRYAEMGELLAQMKSTIEVNRERSEKEIRRELLDEIQRNILESIPKR